MKYHITLTISNLENAEVEDKRGNSILEQSISNGEHKDWNIVYKLIPLYSYYSNRKIIQMLYEYNTEYTKKQNTTCYHEDLNSTGKS